MRELRIDWLSKLDYFQEMVLCLQILPEILWQADFSIEVFLEYESLKGQTWEYITLELILIFTSFISSISPMTGNTSFQSLWGRIDLLFPGPPSPICLELSEESSKLKTGSNLGFQAECSVFCLSNYWQIFFTFSISSWRISTQFLQSSFFLAKNQFNALTVDISISRSTELVFEIGVSREFWIMLINLVYRFTTKAFLAMMNKSLDSRSANLIFKLFCLSLLLLSLSRDFSFSLSLAFSFSLYFQIWETEKNRSQSLSFSLGIIIVIVQGSVRFSMNYGSIALQVDLMLLPVLASLISRSESVMCSTYSLVLVEDTTLTAKEAIEFLITVSTEGRSKGSRVIGPNLIVKLLLSTPLLLLAVTSPSIIDPMSVGLQTQAWETSVSFLDQPWCVLVHLTWLGMATVRPASSQQVMVIVEEDLTLEGAGDTSMQQSEEGVVPRQSHI